MDDGLSRKAPLVAGLPQGGRCRRREPAHGQKETVMYLFTRTARLRPGNTRDGLAWAVGVTERVNQITGLAVGLWTPTLSPGVGTLSWTTSVEHLTDLDDANAKLMVDDLFVEELDRGATFGEGVGADDEVAQILYGDVDPARNPQWAMVVRSEIQPGAFANGMEAGVEIATRAAAIGGLTTLFLASTTGKYGGVAWITLADGLAELEAGEQQVNSDPGFLKYVDEVAPGRYIPGVTTQTIFSRIA
jgi:hypothetical protein